MASNQQLYNQSHHNLGSVKSNSKTLLGATSHDNYQRSPVSQSQSQSSSFVNTVQINNHHHSGRQRSPQLSHYSDQGQPLYASIIQSNSTHQSRQLNQTILPQNSSGKHFMNDSRLGAGSNKSSMISQSQQQQQFSAGPNQSINRNQQSPIASASNNYQNLMMSEKYNSISHGRSTHAGQEKSRDRVLSPSLVSSQLSNTASNKALTNSGKNLVIQTQAQNQIQKDNVSQFCNQNILKTTQNLSVRQPRQISPQLQSIQNQQLMSHQSLGFIQQSQIYSPKSTKQGIQYSGQGSMSYINSKQEFQRTSNSNQFSQQQTHQDNIENGQGNFSDASLAKLKSIETSQLLLQVQQYEQDIGKQKKRQPNDSIIESKSSMSEKNSHMEVALSRYLQIERGYENLFMNSHIDVSSDQIEKSLNEKVMLSHQTNRSQNAQSRISDHDSVKQSLVQTLPQETKSTPELAFQSSTFHNHPIDLIEEINLRPSNLIRRENAEVKQPFNMNQPKNLFKTEKDSDLTKPVAPNLNDSDSSFNEAKDGQIRIHKAEVSIESSPIYEGLQDVASQHQERRYQWTHLKNPSSVLFKFPILTLDNEVTFLQYSQLKQQNSQKIFTFSKCNKNIEGTLQEMLRVTYFNKMIADPSISQAIDFFVDPNNHINFSKRIDKAPFDYSKQQLPNITNSKITRRRPQNAQSFQSEDVLDTVEENENERDIDFLQDQSMIFKQASHNSGIVEIEQAIDNSLNKSNITMEDNNKAQKSKPSMNAAQNFQIQKQLHEEEKKHIEMSDPHQLNSNLNTCRDSQRAAQNNQSQRMSCNSAKQNEKIFELRMDEFNHDTSFDTITSDRLFHTQTEDQFQVTNSRPSHRSNKPPLNEKQNPDDSLIENELKKISKNLNTFTVEHFNNLRSQIQQVGFYNASQKAKKEFNLITAESINTLMSVKDDENEIFITEESRAQQQFQNLYANNTTASKNIYQGHSLNQRNSTGQLIDKISQLQSSNPLLRKILVCEQTVQRNHLQITLLHSAACSGFMTAPTIKYESNEEDSKAFIDKSSFAQLPLGKFISPQVLNSFSVNKIAWLTCGFEHVMVLTASGLVASWGVGVSGCLGHGDYQSYTSPKYIMSQELNQGSINFIESGGYHNSAIDVEGNLFVWGRSDVGQLGLPKNFLSQDSYGFVCLTPQKVQYFSNNKRRIKQTALGEAHSIILDHEGQVYSFGWNNKSQLGFRQQQLKSNEQNFRIYRVSQIGMSCKRIAAGSIFSLALTEDGKLYVWGNGSNGQLGLGELKQADHPTQIEIDKESRVYEIATGDSHAIALLENGKIYGWGEGITSSTTIIKGLRESIVSSNSNGNDEELDKSFYKTLNQTTMKNQNVISSIPKLLAEVDSAHTFLLKKKTNIGSNSLSAKISYQQHVRQGMQGGRYLPSNHTICEVSERDSDYDERSKLLKKNEQKSTLQTCQSSVLQNIQSQTQNTNSLSQFANKFGDQYDKSKSECLSQDTFNKSIQRPKSPQQSKDIQGLVKDKNRFAQKKGSVAVQITNPLLMSNPLNQLDDYEQINHSVLSGGNSHYQTSKATRIQRYDIINKLEEFTHSHIMRQDQFNDSNLKQYNNMSQKNIHKNQVKNLNIQTSLGARNQGKNNLQTQNSILESQSSKRIRHITSVGQIDIGLNSSQNLIQNTQSNNSSRQSQRDLDQISKQNQSISQQNKIKRIRSPQPQQIINQKIKRSSKEINQQIGGGTQNKIFSPKKATAKVKQVPTPRNNIKIQNLQTYHSNTSTNAQIQNQNTRSGLNTQQYSTRNKASQLKTSSQNTSQSNISMKKSIVTTTSQQNLQLQDNLQTMRLNYNPIQTVVTPSQYDSAFQQLQQFAVTTKNAVSSLLSPSRMLQKASLQSGVISLADTQQTLQAQCSSHPMKLNYQARGNHQKQSSASSMNIQGQNNNSSNISNTHNLQTSMGLQHTQSSGFLAIDRSALAKTNGSNSMIGISSQQRIQTQILNANYQNNTQQINLNLNSTMSQGSSNGFNFSDKMINQKIKGPKMGMSGGNLLQNKNGGRSAKVSPKSNRNNYI